MIAIDTTCFSKEDILNKNIVSGIGTWLSEIFDFIIESNKAQQYTLLTKFYAKQFFAERFRGFRYESFGGATSNIILKYTGKSTETYLKKRGINTKVLDSLQHVETVWFPFAIPEIVYPTKKKTVMTVHDFMRCNNEKNHKLYREMLSSATQIIAISDYVKRDLLERFPEFRSRKIPVIPNSISVKFNDTEQCPEINSPFILDINRFEKHKNPETLLRAFNIYVHEMRGIADLVFVGFGDVGYLNELKEYAKKNGISNRVHFFWRLEAPKKNWLLQNASLFVSPSVNEGMGRTPVEAMQCGIPVLTTKETALYEATLGLAKYCDDPYDEHEMAKRIDSMLKERNQQMLNNVKLQVTDEYSVENIWGKYTDIICSL